MFVQDVTEQSCELIKALIAGQSSLTVGALNLIKSD